MRIRRDAHQLAGDSLLDCVEVQMMNPLMTKKTSTPPEPRTCSKVRGPLTATTVGRT